MVTESSDCTRVFGALRHTALLLTFVMAAGCAGLDSDPPLLTAETPLRLEKHIDVATIEASGVPTTFLRQSSGGSTNPNPSGSRSVFRKPVVCRCG